jgi:hypothetical protein
MSENMIEYKTTYLTCFDVGYQFELPKDKQRNDEKNLAQYFALLDTNLQKVGRFNTLRL